MKIKIEEIRIRDFKGISELAITLNDQNTITAPTGKAKSTIEDAWRWLLDGKNSAGDTKFSILPTTDDGKIVNSPKTQVLVTIDKDGTKIVIERSLVVSAKSTSTKTVTKIDGEPLGVNEFNSKLIEIFGANFNILSGLHNFNKLHWTEQRQILLGMVGEIKVDGFDSLNKDIGSKTLDGYISSVKDMLKTHTVELGKIPTRIEELKKTVPANVISQDELSKKRDEISTLKTNLETTMNELDIQDVEIRKSVNDLKDRLAERERELKNSDQKNQKQQEINKLNSVILQAENKVANLRIDFSRTNQELSTSEVELESLQAKLAGYRDTIISINNSSVGNCPTCSQPYPANKKAELQQKSQDKKQDAITNGNAVKSQIDTVVQVVDSLKMSASNSKKELIKAEEELKVIRSSCNAKFAELNNKSDQPIELSSDEKYRDISFEITELETVKDKNDAKATELRLHYIQAKSDHELLDRELNAFDATQKTLNRIKELEAEETKLAQVVALLKGKLDQTEKYKLAMSIKLEKAVADKFKYTKFKLTQENKSGDIDDWCSACLHGIHYSDCSTGQKMLIGIDIINTLSKHYDCYMPLFVDEAQSLTLPIETESQLIRLVAGQLLDEKELKLTKTDKVKFTSVGGFVNYLNVNNNGVNNE